MCILKGKGNERDMWEAKASSKEPARSLGKRFVQKAILLTKNLRNDNLFKRPALIQISNIFI
jgi:hypothetical protein